MSYPKETKDYYFFAPLKPDLKSVQEKENLYLRGRWSRTLERAIFESGVSEIFVQRWDGRELNFLSKFTDQIRRLSIETPSVQDISFVGELVRLEALSVHHRPSVEQIDFSRLSKLHSCVLEVREDIGSLSDCKSLRELTLIALQADDLAGISKLKTLRSLVVQEMPLKSLKGIETLENLKNLTINATQISTLDGLERLDKLERVALVAMRNLVDISALCALRSLCWLSIESCRKIRDVSCFASLTGLRELHLTSVDNVESVDFLRRLLDLERFTFWDNTNVRDGDLSPLLVLPNLKDVGFRNRRHYSHTLEQVQHFRGGRNA